MVVSVLWVGVGRRAWSRPCEGLRRGRIGTLDRSSSAIPDLALWVRKGGERRKEEKKQKRKEKKEKKNNKNKSKNGCNPTGTYMDSNESASVPPSCPPRAHSRRLQRCSHCPSPIAHAGSGYGSDLPRSTTRVCSSSPAPRSPSPNALILSGLYTLTPEQTPQAETGDP
jgi:hypothetical protein